MPFLVLDSSFNRANYPDLIGEVFNEPPGYAMVKQIADPKIVKDNDDYRHVTDDDIKHFLKDFFA